MSSIYGGFEVVLDPLREGWIPPMKVFEFLEPRDKLHQWRDKAKTGTNLEASSWENIQPTRLLEVTFYFYFIFTGVRRF